MAGSSGATNFPAKLYDIIEAGPPSVICWSESGASFYISNPETFAAEVSVCNLRGHLYFPSSCPFFGPPRALRAAWPRPWSRDTP